MPSGSSSRRPERRSLVICISGLSGTGKSTVGRELAKCYGLKYVSGGEALRKMARELGYGAKGDGWWEGAEGQRFLAQRLEDPRFDKQVDAWLVRLGREGNVVIDSWTIAWLLDKGIGLRVWLYGSPEVRARRVAARDGMRPEEALEAVKAKEERTREIYKRIYGFDLWDLSPYDLVVDTDNLTPEEVVAAIRAVVESLRARGEFG